jgi:mRNA interferase HigB
MAMTVLNTLALDRFARKHADARKPLAEWLDTARRASWSSLADVRRTYPSADGVTVSSSGGETIVATVFNVKGNRYRLVTVVHYPTALLRVTEVLTHEQYSTGAWKERL